MRNLVTRETGELYGSSASHALSHHAAPDVVRFAQAGVRLGGRAIWQGLDLAVRPGEFIAILGPNGAGKSTLLKTILGLLPLASGDLTVFGATVRRGSGAIGYLPQRQLFDSDVRVRGRDLVHLGLDGTRWGFPLPAAMRFGAARARAREDARRIDDAIDRVGATAYATRPIGDLSGGEQQRLLIAQTLVTQPRLLLLDEPFEGLDLSSQQSVAALIRRVSSESGIAVLMVAHDVNPILPYVDRVLYIARGQIAVGMPCDVITSDTLSYLYDAPIEVLTTRDGRLVVVGQPEGVAYHAS